MTFPQVGYKLEEKENFWSEVDEVMVSILRDERVVTGADFNDHVGEGNRGDEDMIGRFGLKDRNTEGHMVVDFGKKDGNDCIEYFPPEKGRSIR